jgi:hypothetical protein
MAEPKLKLSKSNARKIKLTSLTNELSDAVRCCSELRLKQSLTLDLCNSVEFLVKDSYGIDKSLFIKHILVQAFNLNDDEQKVIDEQITFLYENNHVKKFKTMRRILNKVLNLFLKKNLIRTI